jgi:hypothetical protein
MKPGGGAIGGPPWPAPPPASPRAWPAPARASAWEGFALRTVPSPTRTARRPRPAALEGVALRFGVWFSPGVTADHLPQNPRVLVRRGALTASLARIKARQELCRLNVTHGGEWLLTSADPCLELFVRGDELRVRVRGNSAAGRKAVRLLSLLDRRDLSIGLDVRRFWATEGADPPLMVVTRARLREISVVPAGACPGCRLLSP